MTSPIRPCTVSVGSDNDTPFLLKNVNLRMKLAVKLWSGYLSFETFLVYFEHRDCFVQKMSTNRSIRIRLMRAYKMMLDFYGLQLSNVKSGKVTRAVNWEERFHHLNQWVWRSPILCWLHSTPFPNFYIFCGCKCGVCSFLQFWIVVIAWLH